MQDNEKSLEELAIFCSDWILLVWLRIGSLCDAHNGGIPAIKMGHHLVGGNHPISSGWN